MIIVEAITTIVLAGLVAAIGVLLLLAAGFRIVTWIKTQTRKTGNG